MSLPYFPMYPTDFEADTAHLSLVEDGAFNRLLRLCWMTPGCSVPHDEAWILRRLRARSEDEIAAVRVVISEFFKVENGRLFSPRLRREALLAETAHQRRVAAGRKGGGAAKAAQSNEKESSNAKAMPKQPEPEPYIRKREAKASPKSRGTRLPDSWVLPREFGEWALGEGWAESAIRIEADKFKDYWTARAGKDAAKLDWLATWRNWLRNSKAPKLSPIQGGHHGQPTSKSADRLNAFVSGARGAS